jgi:hypothetical protein
MLICRNFANNITSFISTGDLSQSVDCHANWYSRDNLPNQTWKLWYCVPCLRRIAPGRSGWK